MMNAPVVDDKDLGCDCKFSSSQGTCSLSDDEERMSVTIATILPDGAKPFSMIPRGGGGSGSRNREKRLSDEDGLGATFRFLDGMTVMRQ